MAAAAACGVVEPHTRLPNLVVEGTNMREQHIKAGEKIMIITLIVAGIFGLGCIYAGIQLMLAPGSGETIFDFLGLHFTTKQAGVASIGLGAIVIILVFRQTLKTLETLGQM
jgi:hypothetical protein